MSTFQEAQMSAADFMADRSVQGGILPPYFDGEAPNRFREANRQRHFLRDWIRRNYLRALARREIAKRRAAAFAAEGLA